jgi:hypothetical protein
MTPAMREAISAYLERITRVFPAFRSFGVGSNAFDADERDYKFELIQLFQQNVAAKLASVLIANSAAAGVVDALIKMFTVRLSNGLRQNLVDWRYSEPIEKLSAAGKAVFVRLCATLLYRTEDVESRVDAFVRGLRALIEGEGLQPNSWPATTRSVTSYLLMLSDPSSHVIVKTREFDRAFDAFLGEPLPDRALTGADYKTIQRLISDLRDALTDVGLEPRDLIDVQSFIWVGDPKYTPDTDNAAARTKLRSDGESGNRTRKHFAPAVWQSELARDILDLERKIPDRTERESYIMARIGQGKFRAGVIAAWGLSETCALTGIAISALLTASHIKPWKDSTDEERMDPMNGLMLAAHADRLFDRHLLSFTEEKGDFRCVIHESVRAEARKLGLVDKMPIRSTSNLTMSDHRRFARYMAGHLKLFADK